MGCSDSNIHTKKKALESVKHPPECSLILSIAGQAVSMGTWRLTLLRH